MQKLSSRSWNLPSTVGGNFADLKVRQPGRQSTPPARGLNGVL